MWQGGEFVGGRPELAIAEVVNSPPPPAPPPAAVSGWRAHRSPAGAFAAGGEKLGARKKILSGCAAARVVQMWTPTGRHDL